MKKIKRALISVSDKNGIVEFASSLADMEIEILSTGGTAKLLQENNIKVIEISDYTGFEEMMDGRLKTLHPKIYGGILGRREQDQDIMKEKNIPGIDLVVVNLYPFEKTIESLDCSFFKAIENIDIGGPTMLRAAAKNHNDITVVYDQKDYENIINELEKNDISINSNTRFELALKAFEYTYKYDQCISSYFMKIKHNRNTSNDLDGDNKLPSSINLELIKKQEMRYGENPHQNSCLYINKNDYSNDIFGLKQTQGKPLSYNNVIDVEAAISCVSSFALPACAIIKHATPCGIAQKNDIYDSYQSAFACDSLSAFGGIIAFNDLLDEKTAKAIVDQQFVEVIIANKITDNASKILANKKNVRVLIGAYTKDKNSFDIKSVSNIFLVQEKDRISDNLENSIECVSKRKPTQKELDDMFFAWKTVKNVKSNAISICKNMATIGIGSGQTSRIFSTKIAVMKALESNFDFAESVLASDAFFPFRDSVDYAASKGIKCIIQPGGSIKDKDIIAAADEHDIAMVFTGMRHFKH